jgi:3-methyladenine DNA glycosylase AlkC
VLRAQYKFTRRFSAEFSRRPFLIRIPERTLARWMEGLVTMTIRCDPELYVRRSVAAPGQKGVKTALQLRKPAKRAACLATISTET